MKHNYFVPDCVLSKALNRARHLTLISCDLFILTGLREEKLDHLIIVKHENDLIKHLMEPGESRAEPSRAPNHQARGAPSHCAPFTSADAVKTISVF